MSKRKGPSRSLFASLPFELKHTLRTQALEPVINATDAVRVKAEQIFEATVDGLLRTQPDSDSESESESDDAGVEAANSQNVEEEEEDEEAALNGTSSSTHVKAASVRSAQATEAGPSRLRPTPVVKSVRYEPRLTPVSLGKDSTPKANPSKRKKGKNPVENPVNPYIGHPWDCTGLVPRYTNYTDVPEDLVKYYAQRRLYFPEYDHLPLLLDRTGWFSITPQPIAAHTAQRCACDLIIDAFCGVGGNTIEFARTCERVIAIDNDIDRLKIARHNALHLGVADRIEFILGDYTDFARAYSANMKSKANADREEAVDVVFLSPPWGGINYLEGSELFPLSALLPIPGDSLFQLTSTLTPNIAYYLPRNTDLKQVSALARPLQGDQQGRKREWVEVEEEWVGEKLKAITAYFGGLVADE